MRNTRGRVRGDRRWATVSGHGTARGGTSEAPDVNYGRLARQIEAEAQRLAQVGDTALGIRLRLALADLARVTPKASEEEIAAGILRRAARATKVDFPSGADSAAVETEVVRQCFREQVEQLQKRLQSLSLEEQAQLEEHIDQWLGSLTQDEREALREAIGVDQLSASALTRFLRNASGVIVAQLLVGSFGFGAYLFLTTFIHALSLLLGITFSFGTYLAATTALAFMLSLPFTLLVLLLSGGLISRRLGQTLGDQMAKLVLLAGHFRMIEIERSQ